MEKVFRGSLSKRSRKSKKQFLCSLLFEWNVLLIALPGGCQVKKDGGDASFILQFMGIVVSMTFKIFIQLLNLSMNSFAQFT